MKNKNSQMQMIAINLTAAHDLMCAIVVRSLRDAGWAASEVENSANDIVGKIMTKMEDEETLAKIATDVGMMKANGASDEQATVMANAAFAVIAVRIADAAVRQRVAQMN